MGKTIAIAAVLVLLIIIGFTVFDIGDGDLAREGNATTTDVTTSENSDLDLNGIGGPEEGVTGFEDFESESEGGDFVPKG